LPASPPTPPLDSRVRLNIAIIGAGVAGLSNAIALKQDGHNVTVYEQACQLSEVGAGIQIPPNSSRILHSWGLAELLERRSVRPSGLVWRRWEDGRPIAHSRLGDQVLKKYGSPYYVTHRAHLHDALHERTQQLNVPVELSQKVQSYDLENSSVTFVDGKTVTADLVIAADGMSRKDAENGTFTDCKCPS
jgi:salicylate hydroxylase